MLYEMQPLIRTLAAALVLAMPSAALAQVELLMGEEAGCFWCARWNEEVGVAYPKTAEGIAAPLRRVNIHAPLPEDLDLASPLRFTPTFVLVHDGKEIQRLEGYPGEDFFWPLMAQMLDMSAKTVPALEAWRDGRQ